MATIYPGVNLPAQQVAQVLLDIVGPERRHEVSTGTAPTRFEVPTDVAVEYERRMRGARDPAPAVAPAVAETPAVAPAVAETPAETPVAEVTPTTLTPQRVTKATTSDRSGKK